MATTISKKKTRFSLLALLAALTAASFGSVGCAGAPAGGYASRSPAASPPRSSQMAQPASESAPSGGASFDGAKASPSAPGAVPAPATRAMESDKKEAAAGDRPGLATHWGESRESRIRTVSFERASETSPFATASLWYNDSEGSRAMASSDGFRSFPRTAVDMAAQGVSISLNDEGGRALGGFSAGGKTYAVGQPGSRYIIVLRNNTPARFEAVVSVDGLDVIDGKEAGFGKRGYLLNPHASLEIEGFRRSEAAVAAFRFGSVRGSYAEKTTGDSRNVGVIGVALFHERGVPQWPWDSGEIERRKTADPFPGRFATPPQ